MASSLSEPSAEAIWTSSTKDLFQRKVRSGRDECRKMPGISKVKEDWGMF